MIKNRCFAIQIPPPSYSQWFDNFNCHYFYNRWHWNILLFKQGQEPQPVRVWGEGRFSDDAQGQFDRGS
jgi:hypothetical protein